MRQRFSVDATDPKTGGYTNEPNGIAPFMVFDSDAQDWLYPSFEIQFFARVCAFTLNLKNVFTEVPRGR